MKKFLMAGVASLVLGSGAMAQIGSPSQTGPGGPPATSAQPPQNSPAPIGSAPGANTGRGGMSGSTAGSAGSARRGDSMTAGTQTQTQRPRPARQQRMSESDRAYMGGGMIMENGVPVGGTSGMMNDRGTGAGMSSGRNADPTGMGSNRMPGGTGSGRGAGSTTGG